MTFSTQRATSDGTLSILDLTIEYIDQIDVHLFVDDVEMDLTGGTTPYTWEWVTPSKIKILPVIPNGSVVLLRRRTPSSEMYHNFDAGAVFKDATVDENFKQVLFLTQESQEGLALTDLFNDLDMHGFDILNLPDATNPQSPVTLAQLNTYVVDSAAALRQDLAATGGAERVGRGAGNVDTALDALEADVAALQLVASEYVRPQDFGAVGDGVADDTADFLAALTDGRPVYLGDDSKTYRLTSEVAFTAARSVVIHSDGAKIIVDSPASIRSAIRIDLAGHGLYLSGRLFLDCQHKSYSGFYATNYGAAIAKADVLCSGLEVSNCFRAGLAHLGGDGIWIGGNLNKLRIVDCSAKNIHMAAGAGISGAQGVSGITVARDNTNSLDASLITIEACNVGPVYSDDVAYTMDQDGIRVFTAYNSDGDISRPSWAVVRDCRFVNCHGRSVKIQTEWASVSNIKIERNGDIYGAGYIGNPDIDFQVAGGQVSNIQANYHSNFPSRIFQFSLTHTDTRLSHVAVEVNNVAAYQVGSGVGMDRLAAVTTEFDAVALINFSGVYLGGSKSPSYMVSLQSQVLPGYFGVNLDGVMGRASVAFVYRVGAILTPCYVTGKAIFNAGVSVPFATSASAGDFTTSLLGANRLVT